MADAFRIKPSDFYRAFNPSILRQEDVPDEEVLPEETVILADDPIPDRDIADMRERVSMISSTQELVDAYVNVHNKFWLIEDDLYDYEKGTKDYERIRSIVDAWGSLMDELDEQIIIEAEKEGLLAKRQPNSGKVKQLEAFMKKYGYRDGCGWWAKR